MGIIENQDLAILGRGDYELILTYGKCYKLVESPVERLSDSSVAVVVVVSVVVVGVGGVVVVGSVVCGGGQQNFADPLPLLPLLLGRGAVPADGLLPTWMTVGCCLSTVYK